MLVAVLPHLLTLLPDVPLDVPPVPDAPEAPDEPEAPSPELVLEHATATASTETANVEPRTARESIPRCVQKQG